MENKNIKSWLTTKKVQLEEKKATLLQDITCVENRLCSFLASIFKLIIHKNKGFVK
jgi:hypothetical protein